MDTVRGFTMYSQNYKIILIGGAPGTGKTTLAKRLSNWYDINYIISTAFLRESLGIDSDYTYSKISSYDNLFKQFGNMKVALDRCINKSQREGVSLIIEGAHVLPWEFDINNQMLHNDSIILHVDDYDTHYKMTNSSHPNRIISEDEFDRIRGIQDKLVEQAKHYNIKLLEVADERGVVSW